MLPTSLVRFTRIDFAPFFFRTLFSYNGELGRKLQPPLGPPGSAPPTGSGNHRSRLSIQHRATYAFLRCIFMRLIIFFLPPPPLVPPSLDRLAPCVPLSRGFRIPRSLVPFSEQNRGSFLVAFACSLNIEKVDRFATIRAVFSPFGRNRDLTPVVGHAF